MHRKKGKKRKVSLIVVHSLIYNLEQDGFG